MAYCEYMLNSLTVVGLSRGEAGTRTLLAGNVMTPNECKRGWIAIEGGVIREVSFDVKAMPSSAVDVGDCIICPAFVDMHNHVVYSVYPRWKADGTLSGRFDWRGRTRCQITVNAQPVKHYKNNVSTPHKEMTGNGSDLRRLSQLCTYGQIRGLIGGTTTMVIDADLDPDRASRFALPGFVRDSDEWQTRIYGILDVTCVPSRSTKELATGNVTLGAAEIEAELRTGAAALLVHVGEGDDTFSINEFYALVDRGLVTRNTALIHAFALDKHTPRDSKEKQAWDLVAEVGAHVVYSPVSNLTLYNHTLKIDELVKRRIPIALSPDWTITGSSSMLDELRFAAQRDRTRTADDWLRSCTEVPADFLRLRLGRIEPGALGDVLVFNHTTKLDDTRATAASVIASATHEQLLLAISGGEAIYGTADLLGKIPSPRLATEPLEIPTRTGTMQRVIRIAAVPLLPQLFRELTTALGAHKLTLAPLWDDWVPPQKPAASDKPAIS